MKRALPYLCLALWATWLFALQGLLAASGAAGAWVPDFGVALVVALAARSALGRALGAALVVALARAALSADPTAALFLGYALVALCAAAIAGVVCVERAVPGAFLAGLGGAWLAFLLPAAAELRSGAVVGEVWPRVLTTAAATALVALLLGGRLRALPGLGPLWQEEGRWLLAARGR